MMRAEIDRQLSRIAAEARETLREHQDDATVSQLVVARTRELLRTADLDDHLHICDTAQHLLLTLGLDDDDDDASDTDDAPTPENMPAPSVFDDPDLIRAVQLVDGPPPSDVGLRLLDDPFDVDAFLPSEEGATPDGQGVEASVASACAPVPVESDRRTESSPADEAALRRGLTHRQLATLDTMSQFGWTLRFVRRPMFLPPIPVAFDRNRQRYVVIEPDGSVDEDPGLTIRD